MSRDQADAETGKSCPFSRHRRRTCDGTIETDHISKNMVVGNDPALSGSSPVPMQRYKNGQIPLFQLDWCGDKGTKLTIVNAERTPTMEHNENLGNRDLSGISLDSFCCVRLLCAVLASSARRTQDTPAAAWAECRISTASQPA